MSDGAACAVKPARAEREQSRRRMRARLRRQIAKRLARALRQRREQRRRAAREREVLLNRLRQRRWYERHRASWARPVRIIRHGRGWAEESASPEVPASTVSPVPELRREPEPTVCVNCGRSLNLGRYKTSGDTCGTCKRRERQCRRGQPPLYASFEEVEAQLEDWTPIPGDPYSGGRRIVKRGRSRRTDG